MKAVILAGGKGERLKPITSSRPKPLIPILCKPLIYWHLDALRRISSIDEIIVLVSYMKERVIEAVKSYTRDVKIWFIDQGRELGTGHAVSAALKSIDYDDEVLIIYGDLFLGDWSILNEIASIRGNAIVGVEHSNPSEYGVIIVEGDLVRGIIEKPNKPPTNLVNAGIYKFESLEQVREYTLKLKPSVRGEYEFTDAINAMASDGIDIRVHRIKEDLWIDIGLPWNVIEANKMALNRYLRSGVDGIVEEGAHIKGRVYIGKGTIVRSGTYIEGPVYIGEQCKIGPSAYIRPYTVICSCSRIGFSVEVKESVIMENVHISHLSYVGDSVICEGVNFGAGTITANLRLDEKPVKMVIKGKLVSSGRRKLGAIIGANVKTGVHVSFMPGVKVGCNSWIAPGLVIYRDVPDNVFVKGKIEYIYEERRV